MKKCVSSEQGKAPFYMQLVMCISLSTKREHCYDHCQCFCLAQPLLPFLRKETWSQLAQQLHTLDIQITAQRADNLSHPSHQVQGVCTSVLWARPQNKGTWCSVHRDTGFEGSVQRNQIPKDQKAWSQRISVMLQTTSFLWFGKLFILTQFLLFLPLLSLLYYCCYYIIIIIAITIVLARVSVAVIRHHG